jgi:uncharacterized protein (TIGR02001 family)
MSGLAGVAYKALIGVAAGAMMVGAAQAADLAVSEPIVAAEVTPNWDIAFGVAGVTDYRFRGITQTNNNPAIQGYAELQLFDWVYAGVWASSVSFPERRGLTDPAAEVDLYAGIRHTWDAFTLDVGGLYYWYPGEHKQFPGQKEIDYWELKALPSYSFGDFGSITGNIWWSSDFVNTGAEELYLSIVPKVNIPVASMPNLGFYISGEVGKQWVKKTDSGFNPPDYWTWNVGGGVTYKAMTVDVRYTDTNLSKNECYAFAGARSWCGSTVVGKIAFDTSLNKLK